LCNLKTSVTGEEVPKPRKGKKSLQWKKKSERKVGPIKERIIPPVRTRGAGSKDDPKEGGSFPVDAKGTSIQMVWI